MPASPEIDHRIGAIGRVEVDRQSVAEHPPQPDRHVGIAGKIKEYLEGVGQCSRPGFQKAELIPPRGGAEGARGKGFEIIGEQDFLAQTHGEDRQANTDIVGQIILALGVFILRCNLVMPNNRPGNQLREEGHKQCVPQKTAGLRMPARHIHQKADLLEGEKGNRQRQREIGLRQFGSGHRIDVSNEEIRVFEQADTGEVGNDANGQPGLRTAFGDHQAEQMVDDDRSEQ